MQQMEPHKLCPVNSMNYEKLKSDPTLCYCPPFKVNLILLVLSNQIPVNKIL